MYPPNQTYAGHDLSHDEEIFHLLVTSVKDYAIFLIDVNGFVQTWNQGAQHIKGYTVDEIKGRHINVFYVPEDQQRGEAVHNMELAISHGRFEGEGWRVRKDGSLFWAHVTLTPLYTSQGILRGFAKVTRDITQKKKAEEKIQKFNEELAVQVQLKTAQLEASTQELRDLSAHLQNIREEERMSMAREIHDQLGQMLTALKIDFVWFWKRMDDNDPVIAKRISGTRKLLEDLIETVRRLSTQLHPAMLNDLGLIAALEWHCAEFEERTEIKVHFHTVVTDIKLEQARAIGVFRIFQESFNNIARHANATSVSVLIDIYGSNLLLTIDDNGKGFNSTLPGAERGLGLVSMRERAIMLNGQFSIESNPGNGTRIYLSVPITPTAK